jgi:hypothetical protein
MSINSSASIDALDSGMYVGYYHELEELDEMLDKELEWPDSNFSSLIEAQPITGSVPQDPLSRSLSKIARQVELAMRKPQSRDSLFRMAGVIKEPFDPDNNWQM